MIQLRKNIQGESLMSISKRSKVVTLDWDNLPLREAEDRFRQFCETLKPVKASLSLSPLKGYHVRAFFAEEVNNWKVRQSWKDDPDRLMYEILRIGYDVDHEFFWDGKLIPINRNRTKFVRFEECLLCLWEKDNFQHVS
jgi:hypothetical protein